MQFDSSISQKLAIFSPYLDREVTIYSKDFSLQTQTVQAFIDETMHTAKVLSEVKQDDAIAQFYSEKLISQFRHLQQVIEYLKKQPKTSIQQNSKNFQTSHRFPKNIHTLRPTKRLEEYKKALRLLNDKISWIIDKIYESQTEENKIYWEIKLQETEYRKQKCLMAIEKTEEELLKRDCLLNCVTAL